MSCGAGYLSVLVQTLYHLPLFHQLRLEGSVSGSNGDRIARSVRQVFADLDDDSRSLGVSTVPLTDALDGIAPAPETQQQDAEEILLKLLAKLRESNADLESKTDALFQGKIQSYLQCVSVPYARPHGDVPRRVLGRDGVPPPHGLVRDNPRMDWLVVPTMAGEVPAPGTPSAALLQAVVLEASPTANPPPIPTPPTPTPSTTTATSPSQQHVCDHSKHSYAFKRGLAAHQRKTKGACVPSHAQPITETWVKQHPEQTFQLLLSGSPALKRLLWTTAHSKYTKRQFTGLLSTDGQQVKVHYSKQAPAAAASAAASAADAAATAGSDGTISRDEFDRWIAERRTIIAVDPGHRDIISAVRCEPPPARPTEAPDPPPHPPPRPRPRRRPGPAPHPHPHPHPDPHPHPHPEEARARRAIPELDHLRQQQQQRGRR